MTTKEVCEKYNIKYSTATYFARSRQDIKSFPVNNRNVNRYEWTEADIEALLSRKGRGWPLGKARKVSD